MPTKSAEEQRIERLEADVKWLKDRSFDQMMRSNPSAILTPNSDGYSLLDTDLGTVTIELTDVVASANGSRATIRIGNTTNATIVRLKAKLEWGPTDEKGFPKREGQQEMSTELDGPFPAGQWTATTVPLRNVPPAQLGHVTISNAEAATIRLYK